MWSISKKKVHHEVRRNKRLFLNIHDPQVHRKYLVKFNESNKGVIYEGIMRSISASGMFIGTQQIPEIHQILEIKFTFCKRPIQCIGQAIYVNRVHGFRPQGFGVKFVRMHQADYKNIHTMIEEIYARS